MSVLTNPTDSLEYEYYTASDKPIPLVKQVLAVVAVEPEPGPDDTLDDDGMNLIDFYARWGFEQVGRLKGVGYKKDKWLDTLILQASIDS